MRILVCVTGVAPREVHMTDQELLDFVLMGIKIGIPGAVLTTMTVFGTRWAVGVLAERVTSSIKKGFEVAIGAICEVLKEHPVVITVKVDMPVPVFWQEGPASTAALHRATTGAPD